MTTDATTTMPKKYASLIGKTIERIRPLTQDECDGLGWHHQRDLAYVIILTDGTALIPACDDEGNGSGHIIIGSVIK